MLEGTVLHVHSNIFCIDIFIWMTYFYLIIALSGWILLVCLYRREWSCNEKLYIFWNFSLISVFIFDGFSQFLAVLILKSHIFLSLRADFCRYKACASLFLLLQVWLPLEFHKVYSILWWCRLPWLPPLCGGTKPEQLCFCLHLLWFSLWNWQGFAYSF